jgi:3-hydroxyacyl-CoA dehydrogenase
MSTPTVTFQTAGTIGILAIHNPPVNAISAQTVQGLIKGLATFEDKPELQALVVHCEGRTFVAGGDIAAFEDPAFSAAPYNHFLATLEACSRPVVAALHGTALGGGLELAMACHWRVAAPGTRVGLPEVKLGLIPGSLGTQRLPRLVGAQRALDLMLSGRMVDTGEALAIGIIDEIKEQPPLEAALACATALVQQSWKPRRSSALTVDVAALPTDFIAKAMALAKSKPHYPAHEAIVTCVHAATTQPFGQGEEIEAQCFQRLLRSNTSKALRHLFFAERSAEKIPGLPKDLALRPIRKIGVLGAGTMGGGIAMCFINAGYDTVLVEASEEALARGMATIQQNYDATVSKGKLRAEERDRRLARLTPSLKDTDLGDCDIVIEAVFENMALKQKIASRLSQVCKPGAIIATNTSTLDVDAIASATDRVHEVLGTHFFSPANVMRLLEVVRGAHTAPDVLATVMHLAKRIGKVAAVSGVCYGFIGNRMAEVYMREAEFLLLEGATPAQIDQAIESLGLAMGPCRMLDMAGIDVGAKTVIEYEKAGGLPPDPTYRVVVRKLFELGQFGQKTGAGYYRYEGRTPMANPDTQAVCTALAAQHDIVRRSDISNTEIIERLIYSMVNEGARILEEGIAYRGSDIDVVWTAGYGFPDHQGGPMFLADECGLSHVVQRLDHYEATRSNPFGYWTVSPLLRQLASKGRRLSQYTP